MSLQKRVLGALLMLPLIASAEESRPPQRSAATPAAYEATTPSGLQYTDLAAGSGRAADIGSTVTVHYTGTLENGSKFDSSRDRRKPFVFTLGYGMVIEGWEEGVLGMKIGGRRLLHVPPKLGYGAHQAGIIPPNSPLIFDIELLAIQ